MKKAPRRRRRSTPDLGALVSRLKVSEGWRSHVYMDTTGHLTIGYGHNLAKLIMPPGVRFQDVRIIPVNGITPEIGEVLLMGQLLDKIAQLKRALPWLERLDPVRQGILFDMGFNLGVPGLLRWPIFLGQVQRGEYGRAAVTMLATLWAAQVGRRAIALAEMMKTGKDEPRRALARAVVRALVDAAPVDPFALPNAPSPEHLSGIMAQVNALVALMPPEKHMLLIGDVDWRERGLDAHLALAVRAGDALTIVAWGELPWDGPPSAGLAAVLAL